MASFVFTLAGRLNQTEDYILNVMPMSRFMQYRHCAIREAGYWTVPPSAAPTEQVARTRRKLASGSAPSPSTPAKKDWSARARALKAKR